MPLLSLWKSNPEAVLQFNIEQVVATAGDGKLKDFSVCSQELHTYLTQVPSDKLGEYAEQAYCRCLLVTVSFYSHVEG